MLHDDGISNPSTNRTFEDVLQARFSRRSLLARSAALSATGFLAALAGDKLVSSGLSVVTGQNTNQAIAQSAALIGFTPVPADATAAASIPAIAPEYQYDVLIPWGTPLQPGGIGYDGDPNTRPTAAQQLQQIGIGHDGMWFFPKEKSNTRGLLAINHEYGDNQHVLGKPQPTSLDDVRLSQHAHGISIVEIAKTNGKWQVVASATSRRIHVNTPVQFSGPVTKGDKLHPLLTTPARTRPQGTVNNCANGHTPWGTYLTCEENFNGYFAATGAWTPTPVQARYGFSRGGFGYGWEKFDPRFDLSNSSYTNEENRFGWVVEIDPRKPSAPIKRSALGRMKHEGAEVVVGRGGRAVVYMGDDERFEYIYKFVSEDNWQTMRAKGISPLDRGTLYVAKFNDNGTGEWLELSMNNPVLAAKFADQAEILTYARLAGDAVGATKMDRPEWISTGVNEYVYCTLTNNTRRTAAQVNAANPTANNAFGHIIRWKDSDQHVGTTFVWDIFVLAKNTHTIPQSAFGSPDGLWADPDGRLFIETDGSQPVVNGVQLNDQLLVADTKTGEIRRLFSGVKGCEVTGITVTPDRRTLFVNLQHPGDGNPALTNFPAAQGSGRIPRDCTIVITRKDGGIIGS